MLFYSKLDKNYDKSKLSYGDNTFFDELNSISADKERGVIQAITVEELGRTLSRCHDSAPGPDGIPYSFYKAIWQSMGPILVDAWAYTLRTGNLCDSHKVNYLKLIPNQIRT